MGLDFSALIHYAGPSAGVLPSITRLEQGDEEPALAEVLACGARHGMGFVKFVEPAYWASVTDYTEVYRGRPALPSLDVCLEIPSQFSLTFGRDAVCVWHYLRWHTFLTESEWQRVMAAAVRRLCELLGAVDCIITNDEHPAIAAFRNGAAFEEALQAAERAGEGPAAQLSELYIDEGYADELAFEDVSGTFAKVPLWNTRGYWRLPLR